VTPTKALTVTPSPIASPMPTRVEYVLPYPGILPTHPLYFLKDLRDKIIELLIADPINKADFYIRQADKKLNMGVMLNGLGKSAETTAALSDALRLRTQAVILLEQTAKAGSSIPGHIMDKLTLSLIKHKEVLTDLSEKIEGVETLLSRVRKLVQPTQQ
jgi:hypothetical protein